MNSWARYGWLALGCLWAFLCLNPSDLLAQRPATPDIVVRGDIAQRQLLIGGRVVWEKAGSHLGRPAVSPDGRMLAISVVPSGTETAAYAQLHLYTLPGGDLLATLSGHSPNWQADSRGLSLESQGRRLIYDISSARIMGDPQASAPEMARQSTIPPTPADPGNAPDYPQFIRVAHHPENTCRQVAAWQVDTIPFEEYVARSVPAEVPVSWALDAIAAQAVAARTYAWYQIRQNRPNYDVTDWADFQMMCDDRYPASNQAVAMTVGQYLSYVGDNAHEPIVAMYSAINGHPTLDNFAVPYLRAVPDPSHLGEERWGHGYGLSQWGAARRARAGQSYRQILGHYYTAVHLQNGLNPGQPVAGLLGPTQNGYLPPGGLRWNTLAPFTGLPGALLVNISPNYTVALPTSGVWLPVAPLAEGAQVDAALYLGDVLQETIRLGVDRTPPFSPTLELPPATDTQTVTVRTVSPPGAVLGLSNGWRWEESDFYRTTDSSVIVADENTANGAALEARPGQQTPGDWFGPYTTVLPPGHVYRALFRLRAGAHPALSADGLLPDSPIARLDVADQGGAVRLGLRDIWASDFAAPDSYQEIAVDFYLFAPAQGLEFRVRWHGDVTLALDRVWVWQLQAGEGEQYRLWRLGGGATPAVQAVAFDAAGNVSPVVQGEVLAVDNVPPVFGPVNGPTGWQPTLPITLTTTVFDWLSGLDSATAALLLGDQSRAAHLGDPGNPWAEQQLSAVLDDGDESLADGIHTARFRIADQLGTAQTSDEFPVHIDRTPPEMAASAALGSGEPISSPHGWFAGSVLVRIDTTDATSGVAGVAYVLDGAPFVLYSVPFALTGDGWHTVRYWAQDMAGNYRESQFFYAGIDTAPPTVWARIIGGKAVQAQVLWGGSDALSGLAGFRVEMRRGEGDWQQVLPESGDGTTDDTGLYIPPREQDELTYRVQAVDRVGNSSPWAVVSPTSSYLFLPAVSRGP